MKRILSLAITVCFMVAMPAMAQAPNGVQANPDFYNMQAGQTITANILNNDLNVPPSLVPTVSGVPSGITVTVNPDRTLNIVASGSAGGYYTFYYQLGNCCPAYVQNYYSTVCTTATVCTQYQQSCTTVITSQQVPCPPPANPNTYCTAPVATTTCTDICVAYGTVTNCYQVLDSSVTYPNLCSPGVPRYCTSTEVTVYVSPQGPDLEVTKTLLTPQPIVAGNTISYQITVKNIGTQTANSVSVFDTWPSQLTYSSNTASIGTYSSGTTTWTVGNMAAGTTQTLVINAIVNSGTNNVFVPNAVTASTTSTDVNLSNNSYTNSFWVGSISGSSQSIDFSLDKNIVPSNGPYTDGQVITYSIVATTGSPLLYSVAEVTDILPTNCTYLSHNIVGGGVSSFNPSTGIWSEIQLGGIFAANSTLNIVMKINGVNSNIDNIATILPDNNTNPVPGVPTQAPGPGYNVTDPNPGNSSSSVFTQSVPEHADVKIAKSVKLISQQNSVPDSLEYTVVVTNFGPDTAENVTVSDLEPSNATLYYQSLPGYNSGTGVWSVGNMLPGTTQTLVIRVKVGAGSNVTNHAVVSFDGQDMNNNNNATTVDFYRYICTSNPSEAFYVNPVPGATSYVWYATGGVSIVSGQGTTNVTVSIPASPGTASLHAYAVGPCGVSDTVNILIKTEVCNCSNPVTANAGPDQTVCTGSNVTMSAAAVTGPVSQITWLTSGSGSFINNAVLNAVYIPSAADIAAGAVTLTILTNDPDGAGPCHEASDNATITFTPTPNPNVSLQNATACGATNGEINLTNLEPFTTYTVSYTFNGGSPTTQSYTTVANGTISLTGLAAGTYAVTVTLGNCPWSNNNIVITQPTSLSVSILAQTNPTTCLGSNGTITFGVLGPNSTYNFTYTVNGSVINTVITTDVNGEYTLLNQGGGLYTNMVFSTASGCSTTPLSTQLIEPGAPTINIAAFTNPTSCSTANGTITIGGLLPSTTYTLITIFNNGGPTNSTVTSNGLGQIVRTGLSYGTYNFNVTNSSNCTSNTITQQLLAPSSFVVNITGVTNNTSCIFYTAIVSYSILPSTSGTVNYNVTYLRNGTAGSTTLSATNGNGNWLAVPTGVYTNLVFTNPSTGCASPPVSFTVTEPSISPIAVLNTVNPSICGNNNGRIDINGTNILPNTAYSVSYVKNGGAPVSLTITSTAAAVIQINNLGAGVYTNITVSLNGCTSNAISATLNDPNLNISVTGVNPTTCGGSNGSFTISGLLPSTTYTISYFKNGVAQTVTMASNGSGQITVSGQTAGAYTNIVADNGNCTSNATNITLTNPGAPTATYSFSNVTNCTTNDGFIMIQGLTPNTTYGTSYVLNGGTPVTGTGTSNGSGNLFILNLGAGNYTNIFVTLAGCQSNVGSGQINAPSGVFLSVASTTKSCNNAPTGSATLAGMQASTSYTLYYTFGGSNFNQSIASNGSGQYTISPLGAGTYTAVYVVDVNTNCPSGQISFVIADTACACLSIPTVSISGAVAVCGTNPVTLTGTFTNTSSATWSIVSGSGMLFPTACGSSGCTATYQPSTADAGTTVTIRLTGADPDGSGPCPIVYDEHNISVGAIPSITNIASTCVGNQGRIEITATSSAGTLEYSIGGTFQTSNIFFPVADGVYTVTVRTVGTTCTATSATSVSCNCPNPPTVTLSAASGSTCVSTAKTVSGNTFGGSATAVTITENGAGSVSPASSSTSPFSFTYTPAAGDAGNTVTITVTTNNPLGGSCTPDTKTYSLSVLATPTISGCPSNPNVCVNNTLTMNCAPSGGSYTVLSGPASVAGNVLTATGAGAISVQYSYTDGNGCSATSTFSVTGVANPSISGCPSNPGVCVGSTLAMNCSPTGGTYTVLSGSATVAGNVLTVTGAGAISVQYSVTVSGCTSTTTFSVTGNAVPSMTASGTNPTSCGGTDGTITLSGLIANTTYNHFRNGSANGTITTNGSGQFTFSGLAAGSYTDSVTLNGCGSNKTTTVLSDPSSVTINIVSSTNPTSCGGSNGSITIGGMTASTSYTLNYTKNGTPQAAQTITSNGSGQYTISGLTAGAYTAIRVTAGGCTSNSVSATLNDPTPPAITLGTITSPSSCGGNNGSIVINGLTAGTYTLNYTAPSGPITQTVTVVGTSHTISGLTAGTYSNITFTIANCTSNALTATVSDPGGPAAPTNLTATPNPVCVGSTVTLTATGTALSWSGPNLNSTSGSPVTATPTTAGTAVYSVTQTVAGCTSPAATISVTVSQCNLPPVVTDTSVSTPINTPVTVCRNITDPNAGDAHTTTVICGPSNGSITSGPTTNNTSTPHTVCITYQPTTSYVGMDTICLRVCDNGTPVMCDTAKVAIQIVPLPLVADAGSDKSRCANGGGVIIGGMPAASNGVAPYSYLWTPSTGLSATTLANPTATPSSTTTYVLRVTDNVGVIDYDTMVVNVSPTPNPTITALPDTVCGGTGLNATLSNTLPGSTITWTASNGLTGTGTTFNAVAKNNGVQNYPYTVYATESLAGCSATVSKSVIVKPTVSAQATPTSMSICRNGTCQITVTGGPVGTSYLWTNTLGQNGTAPVSQVHTNNGPATYIVTYTITPWYQGCPGQVITVPVEVQY